MIGLSQIRQFKVQRKSFGELPRGYDIQAVDQANKVKSACEEMIRAFVAPGK
jgi:hypothetical protein